jgi:hypothetical protein
MSVCKEKPTKAIKMNRFMLSTVMMAVCLLFSGVSCKKDSEFTETVLLAEEEVIIDVENTIVIPADFDWNNIPDEYKDAVWDIQFDFDLNGETIVLPENVTLYFTGGSLSNGTLTGDGTSTIVSKTKYQVFDAVDLAGTFVEEQYLMPYWFGAVMNGITDDRDVFVETLAQAHAVTARVMVDKNIFLDVEELGTKSIFLEDNSWIEGKNDVNIIINNLLSPAFYMALIKDVTIKNVTFLYDNKYDASYDWTTTTDNDTNQQQLETFLKNSRGIQFNLTNPIFKGTTSFHTVFSLEAPENVLFENVNFEAKGSTANTFMQFVIKLKEQYTANQEVNDELTGVTDIPRNITMNKVSFDGVLMGVQGIVNGLKTDGITSYRYSDLQGIDGSNLGGFVNGVYRFPPPHLFYLNQDSATNHIVENIQIINTVDYGEYVGILSTRPTTSGYCNSLKLTDEQNNVLVKNYKSYRRDGLADFGSITNGTFENLYSESDSSIFDSTFKFKSVRFLGTLENCSFENIDIIDLAEQVTYYPFDVALGNYIEMNNLNVYVKELITTDNLCFGISGSNNIISNTSLNIEEHSTTEDYKGIVFHTNNAMDTGSNNNYNITLNGWRDISEDPAKQCAIMYFQSSSNNNWNYSKIQDTRNGFISEQESSIKTDTWIRSEIVDLAQGTSQELKINIPAGFMVKKISANTLESLAVGIEITIGTSTSEKANLLGAVSKTIGVISDLLNENILYYADRSIYLFGNNGFQSTGKIEVTLELVRETESY